MSDARGRSHVERRLEEAQRLARVGVFDHDLSSGATVWSSVMYELHDLDPEAPPPASLDEYLRLLHPDDVEPVRRAAAQVQEPGAGKAEAELRVRHGAGWRHLRLIMRCVRDGDRPRYIGGTVQDISDDADRRGELIRERERARDEARDKTRFLARVTHELRTPLAGVIGMIDLALGDQDATARADHLASARASARHLLELIDDLLDASREDAWRINIVEIELDLRDVLHQAIAMVAPRARRKGLELYGEVARELAPNRQGDPLRLRQILVNLLYNAVKFTPRGHVEAHVGPGDGPDEVVITVSDTGVGIAPDEMARVFEPFVQASAEQPGEGVGLGLAITRELVHALGGTIELASTVGIGSQFTVRLPLRLGQAAHADRSDRLRAFETDSSPSGLRATSRSLRVLVAEDHPTNAAIAQAVLERAGHRPHWVSDGAAAVAAARAERFDAILMDLEMPAVDGVTATRQIRAHEQATATTRMPIIALSAHKGAELTAAAAGMDAFLRKPLDPDVLDALLARAAAGLMTGPIDHAVRLSRVGGRAELARTVASTYLTHAPTLMEPVDRALGAGDARALQRAAHGLRGALLMVGATRGAELAGQLERAALAEAGALRDPLAAEIARGTAELTLVVAAPATAEGQG